MKGIVQAIWWWLRVALLVAVTLYAMALLWFNSPQMASIWYWPGRPVEQTSVIALALAAFLSGGLIGTIGWALFSATVRYRRTQAERRKRLVEERREELARKAGMLRIKPPPAPIVRPPVSPPLAPPPPPQAPLPIVEPPAPVPAKAAPIPLAEPEAAPVVPVTVIEDRPLPPTVAPEARAAPAPVVVEQLPLAPPAGAAQPVEGELIEDEEDAAARQRAVARNAPWSSGPSLGKE